MGETFHTLAFVVFSIITLGSGALVVSTRNLFHAALYLLASLFGVAGLFVLLVAPFLAAIQVLVYMGGVGIMIIIAIMLTRGVMQVERPYNRQNSAAMLVAIFLFIIMSMVLTPVLDELNISDELNDFNAEYSPTDSDADIDEPLAVDYQTVDAIGRVIADRNGFVLPFELASILLTAAMIGAIVIAREDEA